MMLAPCVYTIIKTVEIELAWRQHAKHQRLACECE
jgi:hypothetical protein